MKAVTVYIPEDQQIEAVRLKPLAATLAAPAPVVTAEGTAVPMAGTSQATGVATYQPPNPPDVNADVTYDF